MTISPAASTRTALAGEPRLLLNPELAVLHRPDGTVQLGWGPQTATVVHPPEGTDAFDVGVLLRLLDGGRTRDEVLTAAVERGVGPGPASVLLDELTASGTVRPAPSPGSGPVRPHRVRVYGSGPLATAIVEHVSLWDVRWVRSPAGDEECRATVAADCVVLADMPIPDPRLVRSLMRAGTPHLAVRIRDGHGVVGPFVFPGRSSCLRCADLVRTDLDPSWPRLAAQLYGRPGRAGRAVAAATAAVAVGQLDAYFSTDPAVRPMVDRTVEIDLHAHRITTRRWFRHPECDCSPISPDRQA
ncbi:hypothetical protein OED52_13980 [Rhodococcus sp. Z13]|uniref:Uncharacterized protein n=1 Tax=Rhodococcus sacchari TaxID=2962047 RepID=A0ACD4DCJ4_9NOCA|nr:hypothetical protein [Rhodococcus sp. Z13]UYP17780.1 hypothetical protein OED52_13980 [Rhodococcus sp. Z13]